MDVHRAASICVITAPSHQPRGTDRQLFPAHHGRATNRTAGSWVFSPHTGLEHESEACNPRTVPRSCAEPIAVPPAAKPDEPGNQHRNRQSQPYDSRQNYGDPDRLRICAPPEIPRFTSAQVYGLVVT